MNMYSTVQIFRAVFIFTGWKLTGFPKAGK
jgi:hypothetical protein